MPPGFFEILWEQIDQVMKAPASVFVLLGWIVLAYFLELWPDFPSKWIPPLTIVGSAATYPLFCPVASVTTNAPCKVCVLVVNGLVCGFLVVTLHKYFLKWIISKFGLNPTATDDEPKAPKQP